jgi:hypothetical protein
MKTAAFCDVAPSSLVKVYQCFGGACCLHHQGDTLLKRRQTSTRLHGVTSQKTSTFICWLLGRENQGITLIIMLEKGRRSDVIYNDNDACHYTNPVSFLITTGIYFPGGKTFGTDRLSQHNAKIECVEFRFTPHNVFSAWYLINHRKTFILPLPLPRIQVLVLQKLCVHPTYMSSLL